MKYLRVFLVFSLCLLGCAPLGAAAADNPAMKTECINVAENKPITSNAEHNPIWPLTNLVDGNRMTFVPAEYQPGALADSSNEEIVIDLQRRYRIERIEICNRVDVAQTSGRSGFDLIGANHEDFSDAVRLGGIAAGPDDDSLFPLKGAYTLQLDGAAAYRYIKFARTAAGYYGYGEFKVFAEQTATEVAKGKTATANYWYEFMDAFAPSKAINGTNANDWDCWIAEAATVPNYYYWRVDLGEPMHIGMIEMEGRNFALAGLEDNPITRKYNDVYGSNTNLDDTVLGQNAELVGMGDYKRLIKITENEAYEGEQQFPGVTNASNREMFQSTVDDTEAFQYLTFKKSYLSFAALGAFRAYVINPEVNGSSLDGREITVDFSDKMDASYLTEDHVQVYVNGTLTEAEVSCPDDYTMKLTLPEIYYSSRVRVQLAQEIKNQKNVPLAKAYTLNFSTPPAVDVTEFKLQDAKSGEGSEVASLSGLTQLGAKVVMKNNMTDQPETAVILMVLCDSNNTVIKIDEKRLSIAPGATAEEVAGFDLPAQTAGCRASVFVWRDYNLMEPWITHVTID